MNVDGNLMHAYHGMDTNDSEYHLSMMQPQQNNTPSVTNKGIAVLDILVEDEMQTLLLDTGSALNCMKPSFWNTLKHKLESKGIVKNTKTCKMTIVAANGEKMESSEIVMLNLQFMGLHTGVETISTAFFIVEFHAKQPLILGSDFFVNNNCILDYGRQLFVIPGRVQMMFMLNTTKALTLRQTKPLNAPENETNICMTQNAPILCTMEETKKVPARSQTWISTKLSTELTQDKIMVANQIDIGDDSELMVANAVYKVKAGASHALLVMNTGDEPLFVKKGITIASLTAAKTSNNVQNENNLNTMMIDEEVRNNDFENFYEYGYDSEYYGNDTDENEEYDYNSDYDYDYVEKILMKLKTMTTTLIIMEEKYNIWKNK